MPLTVGFLLLTLGLVLYLSGLVLKSPEGLGTMVPVAAGFSLVIALVVQLIGVLARTPNVTAPVLNKETMTAAIAAGGHQGKIAESLANGKLPDVHLIGHTLFTHYNFPLQILGVLLLVATVGVVVLSKRHAE